MLCILLSTQAWAQTPPANVEVMPVETKEVNPSKKLTGLVDFDRISAVSGEVSGLITTLYAVAGDHIKKGDLLVQLNSDLIQKDKDIKQKQIAQATSDIEKVGRTLKRLESLLQKNSASRQAYDDTRFDLRSLTKKRETLEQEMERLQLQQDKSAVRAPFDGLILEKLKETGEWLTPGSTICRLASTNDLLVIVALPEKLIPYQEIGATIPVIIPALGKQLEGTIRSINPIANKRSQSVTLKIHIPYSQGLIQNLTAVVEIPAGTKQVLQWLPRDALIQKQGKDLIYTVVDGKSKSIAITVVTRTTTQIGVNNPQITAGMPIIVAGNDRLRPNQPVKIVTP